MRKRDQYVGQNARYAKYISGSVRYKRGIPDVGVVSPNQPFPYNSNIWMHLEIAPIHPEIDYLRTEHFFMLASDEFVSCLDAHSIPFETFQAIIDNKGELIKNYRGVHLLPPDFNALDVELSEFTTHPWGAKRLIFGSLPNIQLFTCSTSLQTVVGDEFKRCCEEKGIIGVEFYEPSETAIGHYSRFYSIGEF